MRDKYQSTHVQLVDPFHRTSVKARASPRTSVSSSVLAVNPPATIQPLIQEFLRFIEVSAQFTDISARSQIDLRPDEIQYQEKLIADRETFLYWLCRPP